MCLAHTQRENIKVKKKKKYEVKLARIQLSREEAQDRLKALVIWKGKQPSVQATKVKGVWELRSP